MYRAAARCSVPTFVFLVLGSCAPDETEWRETKASLGPPPGYYASVDTSNAAALRSTLHQVIDDHARFPYTATATDTWDILEEADQDPDDAGRILDVYKNASYAKQGGGNTLYNREHTWPNSYGFPDDNSSNYPYTDCHMLFLSDDSYNTSRSNLPYDTCSAACDEKPTDANGGRGGGTGVYPGWSNWRTGSFSAGSWETWTGRRGDAARAILYADVRYEGGTHGVTGAAEPDLRITDDRGQIQTTAGNASVAYMGMLTTLLAWHAEDPPDAIEQRRNDVVFSYQGNRNPFVDHPEWVGCIFQGVCAAPPECTVDGDCDDADPCTSDTCAGGTCTHAPISCGGGPDHLLVAQVFYDTPGDDAVEEFIDLYNPTSASVLLDGWTLADNAGTWSFPAGKTIGAGAYLTVARDANGFRALFGKNPDVSGLTLALNNTGGDRVVLANGPEVDRVAWESFDPGWSIDAPTGSSIERVTLAADNDSVADWTVTTPASPRGGETCSSNAQCDDGSACTSDVCSGGLCSNTALDCSGLSTTCRAGYCDAATGACAWTPANEGGSCDDGDPNTTKDKCTAGTCAGRPKRR